MEAALDRQEVLRFHRTSRRHGRRDARTSRKTKRWSRKRSIRARPSGCAARRRSRQEEYNEFYKQISNDHEPPAKRDPLHGRGQQRVSRAAVHSRAPAAWNFNGATSKTGLKLYIQRVLIMDHCEALLPPYLRFVRGVVDSLRFAAEHFARAAAAQSAAGQDPNNLTRSIFKELESMKNSRVRELCQLLQGAGRRPQGRHWPGLGQSQTAGRPAAVRVDQHRAGQVHHAGRVRGEDACRAEGDLSTSSARAGSCWSTRRTWKRTVPAARTCCCSPIPIDEFVLPSLDEFKGKKLKAANRGDRGQTRRRRTRNRRSSSRCSTSSRAS